MFALCISSNNNDNNKTHGNVKINKLILPEIFFVTRCEDYHQTRINRKTTTLEFLWQQYLWIDYCN